ncbi:MAG: SpoIIE family protein phosphatase [Firmicutes bacterium]|nr:SpoIIE family protein phosphatase [Bacillota bacterium]
MRKTFQKWLLLFVTAAFAVTLGLSFFIQTRQARANAIHLITLKISDTTEQIAVNTANLHRIREQSDATALAKARALAEMLLLDPTIFNLRTYNPADALRIAEILAILDIDQFHISDEKGYLVVSTSGNEGFYMNYDMHTEKPQSAAFMEALANPDFELAQDPLPRSVDSELFQYAGVARRGERPGIVQIGYYPARLEEAMAIADIANLSDGFRIGTGGKIIVCAGKLIVSAAEHVGKEISLLGITEANLKADSFEMNMDGTEYICKAMPYDEYVIIGLLPIAEMYVSRDALLLILVVCNLILFVVVFASVSSLVQKVVINGIYKVNRSLAKITGGDLDEKVLVTSNAEFVALSEGINAMVCALKEAVAAEAARIDAELEFARAIQHSALPSVFPPYPDRSEFDIYAAMFSAKEVGGDFYDFYLLDDDHLAILIADVSDKGIPAALFMMKSKTVLKSLAESGLSPAEAFTAANGELCENNDAGMFVTAWLGVLEISSGRLTYVNAGHNPPLVKQGDRFDYLKSRAFFVLAGLEGVQYEQFELQLADGDALFLYTDGVTEALNTHGALYGEKRLQTVLNHHLGQSCADLLPAVKASVDAFVGEAPQVDDITMLALRFSGGNRGPSITVPAKPESLGRVLDFVNARLAVSSCPAKAQTMLNIAAEEIFTNIAHYAYPEGQGAVRIEYAFQEEPPAASLTFIDSGIGYNPLQNPDPDTTLSAEERAIGGLGIYMVKKSMDHVGYEYTEGHNRLTVTKMF